MARHKTPTPLVSFTDEQLAHIMTISRNLPVESRDTFLRLVGEQLKIRTVDVVDAVDRALRYMNQAA
jgi:hypothetical protein